LDEDHEWQGRGLRRFGDVQVELDPASEAIDSEVPLARQPGDRSRALETVGALRVRHLSRGCARGEPGQTQKHERCEESMHGESASYRKDNVECSRASTSGSE
jgi:hypothetical protein